MLDHITLAVRDFERAREFYAKALAALGHSEQMSFEDYLGFGPRGGGIPGFWLKRADAQSTPMHLAFRANGHEEVNAFFRAALAAGGVDDGAPGIRAHYRPDYYAAYIVDPEGHHLEVVTLHAQPKASTEERANKSVPKSGKSASSKKPAKKAAKKADKKSAKKVAKKAAKRGKKSRR